MTLHKIPPLLTIFVVISFVTLSLVLITTSPATILEVVGIQNGYLLVLLLAFISGVSPLSGGTYLVLMVSLVAGGANHVLLALIATLGDTLGSALVYSLGDISRTLAPPRHHPPLRNLAASAQ